MRRIACFRPYGLRLLRNHDGVYHRQGGVPGGESASAAVREFAPDLHAVPVLISLDRQRGRRVARPLCPAGVARLFHVPLIAEILPCRFHGELHRVAGLCRHGLRLLRDDDGNDERHIGCLRLGGASAAVGDDASHLHALPARVGGFGNSGGGASRPLCPAGVARLFVIPLVAQTRAAGFHGETDRIAGAGGQRLRVLRDIEGNCYFYCHRDGIRHIAGGIGRHAHDLHTVPAPVGGSGNLSGRLARPFLPCFAGLSDIPLIAQVFARRAYAENDLVSDLRGDGLRLTGYGNGKRDRQSGGSGLQRVARAVGDNAHDLHAVPAFMGFDRQGRRRVARPLCPAGVARLFHVPLIAQTASGCFDGKLRRFTGFGGERLRLTGYFKGKTQRHGCRLGIHAASPAVGNRAFYLHAAPAPVGDSRSGRLRVSLPEGPVGRAGLPVIPLIAQTVAHCRDLERDGFSLHCGHRLRLTRDGKRNNDGSRRRV